jgi:hypothetical protein
MQMIQRGPVNHVEQPRHVIPETALVSVDDDPSTQVFDDYGLVCAAVLKASRTRLKRKFTFGDVFPGDHYRLLAGLVEYIQPRLIVDIGTAAGYSAQVFIDHGHPEAVTHTFDLASISEFKETTLTAEDFDKGRVVQHLKDLKDPVVFNEYRDLLRDADFIMCDGPKDGDFEYRFIELLSQLYCHEKPRWLFLDDIRFGNMLALWRMIKSPKIDLTSFGHFSGSGLVNIRKGLELHI